ncbi:hypothetical protein SEA_LILYPAD_87 [Gordonia phage LilyPad]|nr:hypothetical protein SEA_LILYPAD_87 [Gordonia phage LilyPad]
MSDLQARKLAAYRKMEELVMELSAIQDEEDPDSVPAMPHAWALIVGYDDLPQENEPGGAGSTAVFPKDGSMAGWKTVGILKTVLAHQLEPYT